MFQRKKVQTRGKEKPFSEISIKEVTQNWSDTFVPDKNDETKLYSSLFVHLEKNRDLYLLLKQRDLFHLFMGVFLERYGTKPELDDVSAYATSFISYGIYGKSRNRKNDSCPSDR